MTQAAVNLSPWSRNVIFLHEIQTIIAIKSIIVDTFGCAMKNIDFFVLFECLTGQCMKVRLSRSLRKSGWNRIHVGSLVKNIFQTLKPSKNLTTFEKLHRSTNYKYMDSLMVNFFSPSLDICSVYFFVKHSLFLITSFWRFTWTVNILPTQKHILLHLSLSAKQITYLISFTLRNVEFFSCFFLVLFLIYMQSSVNGKI